MICAEEAEVLRLDPRRRGVPIAPPLPAPNRIIQDGPGVIYWSMRTGAWAVTSALPENYGYGSRSVSVAESSVAATHVGELVSSFSAEEKAAFSHLRKLKIQDTT